MLTPEQYLESLRKLNLKVYLFGELVGNIVDQPMIRPSINSVAKSYELAMNPKYKDLMTAQSENGNTINRFTHLHQSADDLVKKVKMQRLMGQKTASCFQRCVGFDALNAVDTVTFEVDQAEKTTYHLNFRNYLRYIQQNDLVVCGAMTDPKGNRALRPSQQADPDMFLRVVEQRNDGIVVSGAKFHQTGVLSSHEILVMPTIALSAEEKDYAVCFAVPVDSNGLIYVYGRQSSDTRKIEGGNIDVGNCRYGGHEAIVIFDRVFVPKERIFLCGEHEFAGMLVERFAGYHRQSYGGCKVGVGDVLIGAAALISEYNGVDKASHIRDKLIEMNHLNETLFSCGIACSCQGSPASSGTYLIDLLLANICKQNVTRFTYEIARLAEDIAGGLIATLPSEKDFYHPIAGKYLNKYLKGVEQIPTEHRIRVIRLIENLTKGTGSVSYLTESLHGAGSPQAQRVMIARQANLEYKKELARVIAIF